MIVESGEALVNCLAYIDLNPIRAGIVQRPEDYRWSSVGYHAQTDNKDGLLSLNFGLVEFGDMDDNEGFRRYRRHLYEAGAIERRDDKSHQVIDESIVDRERSKKYEFTRVDRFLSTSRYFTDSGIIGSKAFVLDNYKCCG